MPEESKGALRKVGDETVEVFKLVLDLDDASREKLKADPSGFMQRFLESQGYTVNGLTMPASQTFGDTWPSDWVHIPSGEYKSHWSQILM